MATETDNLGAPVEEHKVLASELEWLGLDPKDGEKLTALCLSGGGIRSATFCLGVLQGLASKQVLNRFHYLSTVSGGGYIGSWLSSWIQRQRGNTGAVFSALDPDQSPLGNEPEPIRRLRAHSNYLSLVSGLSIDFVTLVSTFLRNLLLNWLVLVPLLAAALVLPRIHLAVAAWMPGGYAANSSFPLAVLLIGTGIAYVVSDLPGGSAIPRQSPRDRFVPLCFLPILFGAILLSWGWAWLAKTGRAPDWEWYWYVIGGAGLHAVAVLAGSIWRGSRWGRTSRQTGAGWDFFSVLVSGAAGGILLYAGSHYLFSAVWFDELPPGGFEHLQLYAVLSVPFLLACFWLATALLAGMTKRWSSEDDREWWARSGAWWLLACAVWILLFTLVIYVPQWVLASEWIVRSGHPEAVGIGGGLLGIITGVMGYWMKNGAVLQQRAKGIAAALGLRLLDLAAMVFIVVLLLTISYVTSFGLAKSIPPEIADDLKNLSWHAAYSCVLEHAPIAWLLISAFGLLLFGILASWFVGVNTFSLHGMYGNRLVRAYLGATRDSRRPHWFTGFDPEDNLDMTALGSPSRTQSDRRLLHIINIALNLVEPSGSRLAWQQRKAASFTVSPLYAGSGATVGYRSTSQYSGDNGISLGRAMTISGAAASPNMGYYTSAVVAFVMTFFNIRLGWWLPNPRVESAATLERKEPEFGALTLCTEAFARTTDESPYVYLSDGGHFENLALYEMVKRRCRCIVVVDAGCDPNYEFEDLANAMQKIRTDFGVSIEFPGGLPTPPRARHTGRHFAVGVVRYPGEGGPETEGRVIYIKPVLSCDEPPDVKQYAAANRNSASPFPHQSTKDQFFDEAQFESYRVLGYYSVVHDEKGHNAFDLIPWPDPDSQDAATGCAAPPAGAGGTPGPVVPPDFEFSKKAVSGITDALKSIGGGAAVGAAITAGGVIGVAVTLNPGSEVALKPGAEVRLNKGDLERLAKGIPVEVTISEDVVAQLTTSAENVASATRQLAAALQADGSNFTNLSTRLEALTAAVRELAKALPPGTDMTRIEIRIRQLEKLIAERTIPGSLQPDYKEALGQLTRLVGQIKDGLVDTKGDPRLQSVVKTLEQVQTNIERIGPRRNVRSAAEGEAR